MTDPAITAELSQQEDNEDDKVRSFENLKEIYLSSIGGNTTLLLNLPPMKNGKIHSTDVKNVKMLGDFIQNTFKDNLANTAEIITLPEADANGKRACSALRTDDYDRVFRNEDRYQRFAKKKGAL